MRVLTAAMCVTLAGCSYTVKEGQPDRYCERVDGGDQFVIDADTAKASRAGDALVLSFTDTLSGYDREVTQDRLSDYRCKDVADGWRP